MKVQEISNVEGQQVLEHPLTKLTFLGYTAFTQEIFESLKKLKTSSQTVGLDSLQAHAQTWGFIVEDVPSGGNCFFSAVARQLDNIGFTLPGAYLNSAELRKRCVDYLGKHPNKFQTFIDPIYGNYKNYLGKMAENATWADHPAILALAKALNLRMIILSHNHPDQPIEINPQGIATIYLGHIAELHYVSLNENKGIDYSSDTISVAEIIKKFEVSIEQMKAEVMRLEQLRKQQGEKLKELKSERDRLEKLPPELEAYRAYLFQEHDSNLKKLKDVKNDLERVKAKLKDLEIQYKIVKEVNEQEINDAPIQYDDSESKERIKKLIREIKEITQRYQETDDQKKQLEVQEKELQHNLHKIKVNLNVCAEAEKLPKEQQKEKIEPMLKADLEENQRKIQHMEHKIQQLEKNGQQLGKKVGDLENQFVQDKQLVANPKRAAKIKKVFQFFNNSPIVQQSPTPNPKPNPPNREQILELFEQYEQAIKSLEAMYRSQGEGAIESYTQKAIDNLTALYTTPSYQIRFNRSDNSRGWLSSGFFNQQTAHEAFIVAYEQRFKEKTSASYLDQRMSKDLPILVGVLNNTITFNEAASSIKSPLNVIAQHIDRANKCTDYLLNRLSVDGPWESMYTIPLVIEHLLENTKLAIELLLAERLGLLQFTVEYVTPLPCVFNDSSTKYQFIINAVIQEGAKRTIKILNLDCTGTLPKNPQASTHLKRMYASHLTYCHTQGGHRHDHTGGEASARGTNAVGIVLCLPELVIIKQEPQPEYQSLCKLMQDRIQALIDKQAVKRQGQRNIVPTLTRLDSLVSLLSESIQEVDNHNLAPSILCNSIRVNQLLVVPNWREIVLSNSYQDLKRDILEKCTCNSGPKGP